MATDPSVLAVIRAAVDREPDNLGLRAHLASLLLEAGEPSEALKHTQVVLQSQPDNVECLKIGQRAAEQTGQAALAESYGRLSSLLGGGSKLTDEPSTRPHGADGPPFADFPQEPERITLSDRHEPGSPVDIERPTVTLRDVAGLEDVKSRLEVAFLGPLRNPELRAMYGKSLRGGLMLYGPPGCGKTFIARALAGEMGLQFISIGLSDILDMYHGESERKLHELFESARRIKPCVLFVDEVDALGRKRTLQRHSVGSTTVNQLLSELDGGDYDNEGLYVVAATNHPWDVDTALRRPGRFDRTVFVPPPDEPARHKILKDLFQTRPTHGLDLARAAKDSNRFSGADMKHLVESAVENAMAEAIKSGTTRPVGQRDLDKALKEVRPSTTVWLETAKSYAMYSNEGGSYDALAVYLRSQKYL